MTQYWEEGPERVGAFLIDASEAEEHRKLLSAFGKTPNAESNVLRVFELERTLVDKQWE